MTQSGKLEVIWGGMFSGKSEELMRRLRRAQFAKQKIQLFKPAKDVRYSPNQVVSHNNLQMNAVIIEQSAEIFHHLQPDTQVIGIDEAQFLDLQLVEICSQLADQGFRVIVAGLDQTFDKKPFGPMPHLAAEAEILDKLNAVCVNCGAAASRSYRLGSCTDQVMLGEKDKYQALCRHCYNQLQKK